MWANEVQLDNFFDCDELFCPDEEQAKRTAQRAGNTIADKMVKHIGIEKKEDRKVNLYRDYNRRTFDLNRDSLTSSSSGQENPPPETLETLVKVGRLLRVRKFRKVRQVVSQTLPKWTQGCRRGTSWGDSGKDSGEPGIHWSGNPGCPKLSHPTLCGKTGPTGLFWKKTLARGWFSKGLWQSGRRGGAGLPWRWIQRC